MFVVWEVTIILFNKVQIQLFSKIYQLSRPEKIAGLAKRLPK
jgi:hypothetical protein